MTTSRPVVVGAGLVALDVIIGPDEDSIPELHAGGTCGNVITLLSYLGWEAYPVARLGDDVASEFIRSDLAKYGVDLTYASLKPTAPAPIIVERLRVDRRGQPYHTFSWHCPSCGARFPGYKPVHSSAIPEVVAGLSRTSVFFFDRASRSALMLAETFTERGAVVVFEPSGVGDPKLFQEALKAAHVLKYSHERMKSLEEWFHAKKQPLIEIETLGRGGVRYRSRLPSSATGGWETAGAYNVPELRDTTGAGDWFTAGLIMRLCRNGFEGLNRTSTNQLQKAVTFGQALAAWSCAFRGARGGMYQFQQKDVLKRVRTIMKGDAKAKEAWDFAQPKAGNPLPGLCPACPLERPKKRRNPAQKPLH